MVPTIALLFKALLCFIALSNNLADAEEFLFVNDEIYLESYLNDYPSIVDRATPSKSLVLTKSSRDIFFEVFSRFESYKTDRALWTTTQNGRRTLTKMKYTICPIWLADETNVPASVASMNTVMQKNKEFYQRMSWNQHEVTWDFLPDLKLTQFASINNPTRSNVADACIEYMTNVHGKKYPDTHTGLIVAYNPTSTGDLSFRGGIAVINYNITWMSLGFDFSVTRHELGHNYGHPHHSAYSYDWRFKRGLSSNVLDGFDMMSGGNGGADAHLSAASKYFYNWITNDAVIMMQPEGSTAVCPTCVKSITNIVLKPFDNSNILPSASNLMAVHIPVLGVGKTSAYSYWLSYRTNYTTARNGLSMHLARFNLGGMFGATYDSLNFDAAGDTSTTSDSFILNGTCYIIQRPGVLMDIDRPAVEQVQPFICVNDIDVGKSITVSVSFLSNDAPSTVAFKKQNVLSCSEPMSNFGQKSLDMTDSTVHMLEYNGTGQGGNVTFSMCLSSGSASVKAYFYDSYPYAYLSAKAPPSHGAFLKVNAAITCSTSNFAAPFSSENGQVFVLVIAEGQVASDTTVQYSSTCVVKTCHVGQYMDVEKGICLTCPNGHVSEAGSVSLDSCISCVADGLEPVGTFSKDCKISLKANPSLNTGKSWRILLPAEQSATGYSADVDELEFYSSDDCRTSSKISTAGGIAFSSGYYDNNWRPELAFNVWWRWGGRPDSRNLLYLGLTFNRTVTVKCIKYIQPALMVNELRIQAKPENQDNWNNVLIVRSIPNNTNVFPIVAVPTNAPTAVPTNIPTNTPTLAPIGTPTITTKVPTPTLMPSLRSLTTAPILVTAATNSCSSPTYACRAGFVFRAGRTIHRDSGGRCQERCSSSIFRAINRFLLGWKCGPCPTISN